LLRSREKRFGGTLIPDLAERRNNLLTRPGVFVSESGKEGFDCLYRLLFA